MTGIHLNTDNFATHIDNIVLSFTQSATLSYPLIANPALCGMAMAYTTAVPRNDVDMVRNFPALYQKGDQECDREEVISWLEATYCLADTLLSFSDSTAERYELRHMRNCKQGALHEPSYDPSCADVDDFKLYAANMLDPDRESRLIANIGIAQQGRMGNLFVVGEMPLHSEMTDNEVIAKAYFQQVMACDAANRTLMTEAFVHGLQNKGTPADNRAAMTAFMAGKPETAPEMVALTDEFYTRSLDMLNQPERNESIIPAITPPQSAPRRRHWIEIPPRQQ